MEEGISVKGMSASLEKLDEICLLDVIRRILPININAIKTPVSDQLHRRSRERESGSISRSYCREFRRVVPTPYREQRLEIPVVLLVNVQLLDDTVGIFSTVRLRVLRVALLKVYHRIRRLHGSIQVYVCECIENMSKLRHW